MNNEYWALRWSPPPIRFHAFGSGVRDCRLSNNSEGGSRYFNTSGVECLKQELIDSLIEHYPRQRPGRSQWAPCRGNSVDPDLSRHRRIRPTGQRKTRVGGRVDSIDSRKVQSKGKLIRKL